MAGNTYPIILAHGIARFDIFTETILKRLWLAVVDKSFSPDRLHYFRCIAPFLRAHGFEVYTPNVSFAAPLAVRAHDLAGELRRVLADSGHRKAHIIGHSMGGLDARAMIVNEDVADKVASLTTIGVPHWGTTFAEWGLAHGGYEFVKAMSRVLDVTGFEDITPAAVTAFNERARHAEATNDVVYRVYWAKQDVSLVFSLLQPAWHIIFEREGENDGLVSVRSQKWVSELVGDDGSVKPVDQVAFPIPADHLNQVGWWDLRELRDDPWWRTGIGREKTAFETAVKNSYLQIAQEVTGLEV
jgi:triacylglycerol lipase